MVDENLKPMQAAATGTSDVLSKGIEDAKGNLDELDAKLAAFKKKHAGQLPGDEDNNLKILMGLNSQLEANTQTLNRAQQDKAYTESVLAQQLVSLEVVAVDRPIRRRCENSCPICSRSCCSCRRGTPTTIRM